MKVLAAAGDIGGLIAGIRLLTPLRALCRARGWSLIERSFHDCRSDDVAGADVFIVQRAMSGRVWRLQRRVQRRGGTVLHDIDDLLTDVPAHISNHASIAARQSDLHRCLLACDVLTVSTDRLAVELATDLRRGAGGRRGAIALPPFFVVPNASGAVDAPMAVDGRPTADTGSSANATDRDSDNCTVNANVVESALERGANAPAHGMSVTLLIASSDRLDVGFLHPALRSVQALLAAAGRRGEIVVVGPPGRDFAAAGLAVRQVPSMPRAAFIAFARSLPGVVAVIPLGASRFSACKSAIKWFEFAEAGVPVACSAVSPYRDVVEHGCTGWLVENDAAAWQAVLTGVAMDAALRRRTVAAARAAVRARHGPERTVEAWGRAIDQALTLRQAAALTGEGWLRQLQQALFDASDEALAALGRLNRERLARRTRRRGR